MKLKNYLIIFIIVMASLTTIEGGIRLWGYFHRINHHQKPAIKDEVIRILCIGESTSAPYYVDGVDYSFPKILDDLLKNSFGTKNIEVINVSNPSITSSQIAQKLSNQIQTYSPQIVISMLGINDHDLKYYTDQRHSYDYWNEIKILKLARLIKTHLFPPKTLSTVDFGIDPISSMKNPLFKKILKSINRLDVKETLSLSEQLFQKYPSEKAALLRKIGEEYWFLPNKKKIVIPKALDLAFDYFQQAYNISSNDGLIIERYTHALHVRNQDGKCLEVFEKLFEKNKILGLNLETRLIACATENLAQPPHVARILKKLPFIIQDDAYHNTQNNYRYIQRLLSQNNIVHLAISYPRIELQHLQILFSNIEANAHSYPDDLELNVDNKPVAILPEFKDIIFVNNESNFNLLLKEKNYNDLFIDYSTSRFGHTTKLGHEIIARNIYKTIIPIIKNLRKERRYKALHTSS